MVNMSDTVRTIAVAALTSGVVALGIEYAAKPRLEARKERILARWRTRDSLRRQLLTIGLLAKRLDHERLPPGLPAEARSRLIAQEGRIYTDLQTAVEVLLNSLAEPAGTYPARVVSLLFNYSGIINGVIISERNRSDKARIIVTGTMPLLNCLFDPWWRPIQRVRGLLAAEMFVKEHGVDGEAPAPTSTNEGG